MPSNPVSPISEIIALNIVSTLEGIEAGLNYANTVALVSRPNPGYGTNITDRAIIVSQGDPELAESSPQGKKRWWHPFEMLCDVVESQDSGTAIDTRLNTLRADVEKSLRVDVTRGGYAINTVIEPPTFAPVDANAHTGSVTVRCRVLYDTLLNDPYSQ